MSTYRGRGARLLLGVLLLARAFAARASPSSSSCISRPSAISLNVPCVPTTEAALAACLGGDAALAAHVAAHGFATQHLTVINLRARAVRVFFVDSVGREHDYGRLEGGGAVHTQETFPMHAWRVYDDGGDRALLLEMVPTGRVPPMRQEIGQSSRNSRTSFPKRSPNHQPQLDNMRFHETVKFQLSPDDATCTTAYHRPPPKQVRMLNGVALPHEGDIFGYFPEDSFQDVTNERAWPRPKAEHEAAKSHCLRNLDMHDIDATFGTSIYYTSDDATPGKHLNVPEMAHHIASVVRQITLPHMEKSRRLDISISRTVDITITLSEDSAVPTAARLNIQEIAQAAKETGLDFFDTVFIRIWIAGAENISLYDADHGGDQHMAAVITAVARAVDHDLIRTNVARSWGLVAATWKAGSCLRQAWAASIVEGIAGPTAGLQQDWSSVVYLDPEASASEGYARQLHGSWMPLLEANQAGVFAFTASAQNLYALHQNSLPRGHFLTERTVDHPDVCDSATLLPPLISVAVRSDADSSRISPDIFCGASNKRCGKEIDRDWRQRNPPGDSSIFDNEEIYDLLRTRAEKSWAKSTGGVPWTQEDRRKRFVLDGLLNTSECEMLRRSGRKHMLSGASYSGRAKKDSASNNNHGAAFTIIDADVSSDEAIAARTLFRDALSRIRGALMAYFNLTKLVCSNSQLSARYPPGTGHPIHSDDCIYRNDSGVCEPSNKVHECCVNYVSQHKDPVPTPFSHHSTKTRYQHPLFLLLPDATANPSPPSTHSRSIFLPFYF